MNVVEISLDLETFSNTPDSAIASIGAVDTLGREFYRVVDDCFGKFRPQTIRWHLQQENPILNVGTNEEAVDITIALSELHTWLTDVNANEYGAVRIWTHATFDIPILNSAYNRIGLMPPWHYTNCRDLRTMYDLAGGRPELEPVGNAHNALDDAKYQLKEIQYCLSRVVLTTQEQSELIWNRWEERS